MLVGAHLDSADPLGTAAQLGADAVQIFLSNPQSWKKPEPQPHWPDLNASPIAVYVHAPYLINVCNPRNNVRFGSRKILKETCEAAAVVEAAAVIVHGGHADDDLNEGIRRWKGTLEPLKSKVPVLIENTAGGDNAVARSFDALARLWDVVGSLGVGFCFDTCHAHAAGEDLSDAVERVLKIVGRIDLVHCNDSKDPHGSGRDRHENIGRGKIPTDVMRDMLRASKAPAFIVETPRDLDDLGADVRFVRDALQ